MFGIHRVITNIDYLFVSMGKKVKKKKKKKIILKININAFGFYFKQSRQGLHCNPSK